MIAAPASPTRTSSGAMNSAGTRTVFIDRVRSRLIISAATSSIHTPTTGGSDQNPGPNWSSTSSGATATSAAAGAGTPTKNSLAYGGCSVSSSSVLNRASRSAAHTAKTSATTQPRRLVPSSRQMNSTSAGDTPKDTQSASESSSAPILLVASSSRAIRPSRL